MYLPGKFGTLREKLERILVKEHIPGPRIYKKNGNPNLWVVDYGQDTTPRCPDKTTP